MWYNNQMKTITKKEILKKACGKGGPVADTVTGFKRGAQNIKEHTSKNYNEAYANNMAKYKEESAINKNNLLDKVYSGAKGAIYGGVGALHAMGENIKSNVDKVKSIVSPQKEVLKNTLKTIPSYGIRTMPLNAPKTMPSKNSVKKAPFKSVEKYSDLDAIPEPVSKMNTKQKDEWFEKAKSSINKNRLDAYNKNK